MDSFSLSEELSSLELSESWIRQSSAAAPTHQEAETWDIALTHLAIMGLWMGRHCREITNNTDALFQTDSKADSGGFIGQRYSASIASADNTLMVNRTSTEPVYTVRKHVRSWKGKETAMDLVREVRVLTHAPVRRHPNIVKLVALEWVFWPGEEPGLSPVLCLERSELGDLAEFQRGNCLSDDGYRAKVCDFGFAVFTVDIQEKAQLRGGTYPWTAPEFRKELPCPKHLLKLADVYSLGLLFWRMLLGGNPFSHHLLQGRDVEVIKSADPPLVYFAQASIALKPEYSPYITEIWALLACTIQQNPLKRKLRTAIRIASKTEPPAKPVAQLSNNPLIFARGIIIKNICVPVRLRLMKYLQRSAIPISTDPDWKSDFPGENPLIMGLIEHALGDVGLDIDDNPDEALRWITYLAEQQFVPMQAIIVRMYDYFDKPMPLHVAQKANEYLANGVATGSATACLDYEKYWPSLEYQTWDRPENFFFMARTFHGNGTGFGLNYKAADLRDTVAVYENILLSSGHTDILQEIYGLDRGNTLLHGCAMLGLAETAQMLLTDFGADINAQNDNGDTPLLLAVRNGKFPMILKLVAKGARADIPNNYGETPLHWVLNIPSERIVHQGIPGNKLLLAIEMLLYAGGSLDAQAEMWCAAGDFYDRLRWAAGTPLHRAVSRRNIVATKALLLTGAGATVRDMGGLTALDIAMHHHNEPMLRMLLDSCDFDVNTHYPDGHTLYSRAVSSVTILEMITIHGKDYPKAVHATLDLLLSRGFDITRAKTDQDQYELDALFVAAVYEKIVWVRYFLTTCIDVDINRPNGEHAMTALHQSIHDHHKSIFLALLDAGADPALTCSIASAHDIEMKLTSLHLVAQQGDPDLFFTKRLLEYTLDIDAPDFYGITPFAMAVIEGNLHIANLFLEHGADINARMGTSNSRPETRTTILGQILTRDCSLIINRLKYLVSDSDGVQRHGPPAALEVGRSTALDVFLNAHRNRQDGPFQTCLQILKTAYMQDSIRQ